MKDYRKFQFGFHLVPQYLPKKFNKLGVPIRHHGFEQPIQFDYMIK